MDRRESQRQRIARVAQEIRNAIGSQAHGRWSGVRVAERNEPGRHVWRFQTGADRGELFLHIEHRAMAAGKGAAARLLEQLGAANWLDRLQAGPGNALLLSHDGRVAALPRG